jgi:hypothetical protein
MSKSNKKDKNGGKSSTSSSSSKPSASVLNESLYSEQSTADLISKHETSAPYRHVVIDELCNDSTMRLVHDEMVHNMRTNYKETDLFKLYQTGELAVLEDDMAKKMPNLVALRNQIYSAKFRDFVQKITGCEDLIERVVSRES